MRPPVAARVTPLPGGAARVELLAAEEAVAPGQACVFYSVTAGFWAAGWIAPRPAAGGRRGILVSARWRAEANANGGALPVSSPPRGDE